MDREPRATNRELEPESVFEENDSLPSEDVEVENRLADWLETNRIENATPIATLYKLLGESGDHNREQCDYYRGVFPTRHEIGLEYGPGRYMLLVRNTSGNKGAKQSTVRFRLHESYAEKSAKFKRERVEKERLALGPSNGLPTTLTPPQTGKESLIEAFTLVRSMQADTLAMFKPILERILTPPAAAPALPAPKSPFEDYALSRQIMKDSLKENMSMITMMQKAVLDARTGGSPDLDDDEDKDAPAEKESMFERIIALAEPFINILAQNNVAAKMAAAGIKAAPQFREVIKDAGLARRIINYVETKEGPERAGIALKNLGLAREDYIRPAADARVPAPRPVVPAVRGNGGGSQGKPGGSQGKPGGSQGKPGAGPGKNPKLNPKMEVKV